MIIGFIGSGNIGSTLARLALDAGHSVIMSNSRGPETLDDLIARLGDGARAATPAVAGAEGDLVVVTIPFGRYQEVPVEPLAGKIVIDTDNYYPKRDGTFADLDAHKITESEYLARHLPTSRVVKAFNAIYFEHLATQGQPAGTENRRALTIAGDDAAAKKVVADLIDSFGYDVVDAGPLVEGRRTQPDTPAYYDRYTAKELRAKLAEA